MKLQDQLHDAVADVSADLPALAGASRRQGLAIRRRRRALATVGAAAAVAVVAVAGVVLRPGTVATDSPAPSDVATEPVDRPLSGQTVPNSGRATAASLLAAVTEVADGTASRIVGGDPDLDSIPPSPESLATFLWTPTGSRQSGVVFLNLQAVDMAMGCADLPSMHDCRTSTTPAGDTLVTYRDTDSDSEVQRDGFVREVVEVISPERGLRVILSASNNRGDGKRPTRSAPVLTLAQLKEVATQPWWGFRLPAQYAGDDLPGYRDAEAPAEIGVPTSPSPQD